MSHRMIPSLAALFVLAACEAANPTLGDPAPETPTGPPSTPPVRPHFHLILQGYPPIVGSRWGVYLHPREQDAAIGVSDPAVAVLEAPANVVARASLRLVGPGQTTVYARSGSAVDSVIFEVFPAPPPTTALVVDSFKVIEHRATCAWDCPYLLYAPLLWLREPTGSATAEVLGVQFGMPSLLAGAPHQEQGSPCEAKFGPGQSAQVIRFDPYPWNNDLLFVSLEGIPLPDEPATARVVVRDSNGQLGLLDATGTIRRNVADPDVPFGEDLMWCAGPS